MLGTAFIMYLSGVDVVDELAECITLELRQSDGGGSAGCCGSHRTPRDSANFSPLRRPKTLASVTS